MSAWAAALVAASYLLGSVPFGLLLTRAAGLGDIRAIGSGNIGATNVLRTGRRWLAAATLLLDALKGFVAVLAAGPLEAALAGSGAASASGGIVRAACAVAVVVGHCAPVWLGFRGGKGVATGLGALLGLDWRVGAIACAAWLLAAWLSRRSSVGAIAAFVAAAIAAGVLDRWPAALAAVLVATLVVARHRANIARLIEGREPRIGAAA